jgi:integrase
LAPTHSIPLFSLATATWVSTLDPITSSSFQHFYGLAQETVRAGVSAGRARNADTVWSIWETYCVELGIDPFLETFTDKVPILQVVAQRVRIGELAAKGDPIRSRSTEDYIRQVAATFQSVGAPDPRLNSHNKLDFRLKRMVAAWKKQDPPPNRVKPIPMKVLRALADIAQNSHLEYTRATTDMIIIAFYFLLRPGEYVDTNRNADESDPFKLADTQLFTTGQRRLDLATASDAQLLAATSASLTFTTQKNGVRGEVISLGRSGDPYICPVLAIARRVIYLRKNNAPEDTPLARLFQPSDGSTLGGPSRITSTHLTRKIRRAVKIVGPSVGFLESDVSVRCLRAAGANTLLLANVDGDVIRLIGRWRSDEMLRYLHTQAAPLMSNYAKRSTNHSAGDSGCRPVDRVHSLIQLNNDGP